MALTTYSELQTAIANWLDRSDLSSRIPEFIALAEARFGRELRTREMETRSTASTTAGDRTYGLPAGYVQMRNIQLNTDPIQPLDYLSPEMMDRLWAGSKSGRPKAYTIIGDELHLGPAPDIVYTIEMVYYKRVTALSGSNTSNWMLTNNPDVYLYGALLEAEPYLHNDTRIAVWLSAYKEAINNIQDADGRDRFSGSALRVFNEGANP